MAAKKSSGKKSTRNRDVTGKKNAKKSAMDEIRAKRGKKSALADSDEENEEEEDERDYGDDDDDDAQKDAKAARGYSASKAEEVRMGGEDLL